jgi:hypothetical protein
VKRGEFSRSIHKHIVRTLTLRSPGLTSDKAQDMAVVILGNMKTMAAFSDLADQSVRPGAIEELREMTRILSEKQAEDEVSLIGLVISFLDCENYDGRPRTGRPANEPTSLPKPSRCPRETSGIGAKRTFL